MNREIKFRFFVYIDHIGMSYPKYKNTPWDVVIAWCDSKNSDRVIMQFTGLLDKNGKEIYEGDILKADRWKFLWIVQFDQKRARFNCIINPQKSQNDYIPGECVEVIGNIYENPELLK